MSELSQILGALSVSGMAPPLQKGGKSISYIKEDTYTAGLVPQGKPTLQKSLLNLLDGGSHDSIERLAFERDPSRTNEYASIYRAKNCLIPDHLLKRVAIQDSLVAAIVHTRSNHLQSFGREQVDRFSTGYKIDPDRAWFDSLDKRDQEKVTKRVKEVSKLIQTCGHTKGWSETDRCSFAEYLYMTARNAVVVGRSATEVVWAADPQDHTKRRFHSFRPTDAGTIYFAAPYKEASEAVRKQARRLLEQLKNEKLTPEAYEAESYDWVQVIDGKPFQVFTAEEMLVQNFYPTTDVELNGYPLTPIDTAISAIATHINIVTHNKLYFQNGRAAKGMLVIRSDDVDAGTVNAVRLQFNASINGAQNAFRMPVFGVGVNDEISWQPIDSGGRDMEFQYLYDQNAREIMAAFQMSPEELPGYQHLSRGANSQALSESNSEYKLEAARDVGIRPLIAWIEDFINASLMPLLAPDLYEHVKLRLVGLEAETPEKESIRLQQDMPVHMTYSEVLEKVEKKPVSADLCGELPLNPQYNQHIQNYMTFGEILEKFRGVKDASKDENLAFYQNPFWFQAQQLKMAQMQMQMQMQQMQAEQQQAQMQAQQAQGAPQAQQPAAGAPEQSQAPQQAPQQPEGQPGEGSELGTGLDQLIELMSKSETLVKSNLPAAKRRLRTRHELTVKEIMDGWHKDSKVLLNQAAKMVVDHAPKA